jgi:DNA-binding FrmR family transcriptional regulator
VDDAERKDLLNRIATIEGHLRGIRRMIEDDTYCIEVLKQTHAVQRAIAKLEDALLQGHLVVHFINSCRVRPRPAGIDRGPHGA